MSYGILTLTHRCPCKWCRPACKALVRNDFVICMRCISLGHLANHPKKGGPPPPSEWKYPSSRLATPTRTAPVSSAPTTSSPVYSPLTESTTSVVLGRTTYMDRNLVAKILSSTTNHALLYGPRGVAKTTTAVESATPSQVVFQTTFTAEAGAASYLGHFVPKGNEFIWHKGPFQRAWEEGGLLVINEIDHASEDVSNLLHAILDSGVGAYLTLPTGDTIHPAPGFRCIATMNGRPEDLASPVLDRFGIRLPVLMPSKEQLDSLPDDVATTCKMLYERGQHETTTFRMLANFVHIRTQFESSGMPTKEAEELAATTIYGDEAKGKALLKALNLNRSISTLAAATTGV